MNHAYTPSKLNPVICATCRRNMIAHLPNAECESCAKSDNENGSSKLELVNDILLCRSCFSKELETVAEQPTTIDDVTSIAEPFKSNAAQGINIPIAPSEQLYITARSIASDLPANGSEYYNAKVIAIVELEKRINNDPDIAPENKAFFFAQQIQARQNHLYKTLVSVKELITEIDSERHANFRAINALASRLKKEEREKLNIKYAEYVVPSKITSVKQPRMNAQDKVIEGIAKMMFAPRIDGIIQWEALEKSERQQYVEKAKQYFKGTLKP